MLVPKISFQNPVHVLVKWSGRVISGPVMIIPISVSEEISGQAREETCLRLFLGAALFSQFGEIIFEGSEFKFGVQLGLAVDVVEQLLVVVELGVPLSGLLIPEVIAQGNEYDIAAEELRLLAVLVQDGVGAFCHVAVGDGLRCNSPRAGNGASGQSKVEKGLRSESNILLSDTSTGIESNFSWHKKKELIFPSFCTIRQIQIASQLQFKLSTFKLVQS